MTAHSSQAAHGEGQSDHSSRRSSDAGSISSVQLFWRPAGGVTGKAEGRWTVSRKSSATSMGVHEAEHADAIAVSLETGSDKSHDRQKSGAPLVQNTKLQMDGNVMGILDVASTTSLVLQSAKADHELLLLPAISPALSQSSTVSEVTASDSDQQSTPRGSTTNFTTWGLANPSRRSLNSFDTRSTVPIATLAPITPTKVLLKASADDYLDEQPSPPRERDRSIASVLNRKGRKQPPNLTESLELLASMSISPRTAAGPLPDVDVPTDAMEESMGSPKKPMRVIEVDLPPLEPGSTILMKVSAPPTNAVAGPSGDTDQPTFIPTRFDPVEHVAENSRRKSSQQSIYSRITRRQSSLPALMPATVKPAFSGPRFSLFPNSRAHKAISLQTANTAALAGPASPDSAVPGLSCSGTATESTCGTWDMDEEPFPPRGISGGKRVKETRKQRKARQKAEKDRFDAVRPPDKRELFDASMLEVVDERGEKVTFGELVRGKKTIVVFLRHWFCSMCAQYMKAIVRDVRPAALERAGVQLIVIGNGSAKMIDGYAYKHFKSPFRTYTDPTLLLYRTLGLTRQTTDSGADEDQGDYLTESVKEQTIATIKRATKMPLRNPGHFTQLGGEFIFDGPMNVIYTHRMINTRDHAPIRDVCAEAGVQLEHIHYEAGRPPPLLHRPSTPLVEQVQVVDPENESATSETVIGEQVSEFDDWKAKRDATLAKMRILKEMRSEGVADLKRGRPQSAGLSVTV